MRVEEIDVCVGELEIRRAKRRHRRKRAQDRRRLVDLGPRGVTTHRRERGVRHAVAGELVSVGDDALDRLRESPGNIACREKRGRHVQFAQHVEQQRKSVFDAAKSLKEWRTVRFEVYGERHDRRFLHRARPTIAMRASQFVRLAPPMNSKFSTCSAPAAT